jgi:hypothetical protein
MVRPVTPLDGSVIAEQAQALSRYLAERFCESLQFMHVVGSTSCYLFKTELERREHGTKVDWESWFDQPNNEILRASGTMELDYIDMAPND